MSALNRTLKFGTKRVPLSAREARRALARKLKKLMARSETPKAGC